MTGKQLLDHAGLMQQQKAAGIGWGYKHEPMIVEALGEILTRLESKQPAEGVLLAKHQPCGCVVCTCEDEDQCQGCGAKNCGKHPVGQLPNPVYEQPAEGDIGCPNCGAISCMCHEGIDCRQPAEGGVVIGLSEMECKLVMRGLSDLAHKVGQDAISEDMGRRPASGGIVNRSIINDSDALYDKIAAALNAAGGE